MNVPTIFDAILSRSVTLTLVHFLWQGTVLAIVAGCLIGCLRRSAQSRYLICLATLLLMVACLPVTFALVLADETDKAARITAQANTGIKSADARDLLALSELEKLRVRLSSRPASGNSTKRSDVPPSTANTEDAAASDVNSASSVTANDESERNVAEGKTDPAWETTAGIVFSLYCVGVVLMLARLFVAVYGGQRLRRSAFAVHDPGLLQAIQDCALRLRMRRVPLVAFCPACPCPW